MTMDWGLIVAAVGGGYELAGYVERALAIYDEK
jgi:hypothetical protein